MFSSLKFPVTKPQVSMFSPLIRNWPCGALICGVYRESNILWIEDIIIQSALDDGRPNKATVSGLRGSSCILISFKLYYYFLKLALSVFLKIEGRTFPVYQQTLILD